MNIIHYLPATHRRSRAFPLLICFALLMIAVFSFHGFAEGFPESEHPYAENSDNTWNYTHEEEAYALKLTFSEDTELEANFDFLYIIDEAGIEQKFTGTILQSNSVYVLGDSFTLRLTSDSSINRNGFTITEIESVTQEEYEDYIATPRYTINSSGVITAYSGLVSDLVVPSEIDGVTVTGIGGSVFRDNTVLTSITLPEGVTYIGYYAFRNCSNLTSIDLPSSISSIGLSAFRDCGSLTDIVLPDGITSIESNAFDNCSSLTGIDIPDSVTSIGNYAFRGCSSLTNVDLSDNITSIESYVFDNCSGLTGIDIPDSVTSIGNYAFRGCGSLTNISLNEGLVSIGNYAFDGCSLLKRIELPDSLESLGTACFSSRTILVFGSSEVIEAYALQYGYQYISDNKTVVSDGITDPDEKVAWVVATYTEPSMSEYEKALRLYDWVCANVQYDYQYYNDGKCDGEYSSELGVGGEAALIDGWAVCQGYSEAYQWLLEEAGIEAKYVRGYNHAWNIAKIDGEWYQFDTTWDERGNGSQHDYFALSDMAIHSETKNHSSQYTYRHLVCDSWEANYFFKNGCLDAALTSLRSAINESIAAGTYSGALTVDSSDYPDGQYSEYTIALILNNDSDWDIAGRVEITPNSNTSYDFIFYPDEVPVTDIIVEGVDVSDSEEYYYMYPGYAAQMNVSTLPQGKTVSFASSDESVATVSENGLVTAIAKGEANIILTSGNYSRAFSIYVRDISWLLDTYSSHLDIGENTQVELNKRYNWFLTDSAAVWSSADEAIATVSQTGLISGIGYGSTTITLTTAAGVTDTVTVYVRKPVTAIVFDQEVYESYTGLEIRPTLHAEGCDQEAYRYNYGNFTYTVSNEAIADYDGYYSPVWVEDGAYWQYRPSVECFAPGEITLTATAKDGSGVSGSCTIIIREAPKLEAIAFVSDTYEAMEGQKIDLVLRTESDDADFYKENYGSFAYTSSDDTIVTHYNSYSPIWNEELNCWEYTVRINCLAPGEVTFTATAKDGSDVSDSCTIIVSETPKLETIAFVSDTYEAMEGQKIDLVLRTESDDADFYKVNYGSFTYTSSDDTIVTYYNSYSPIWNEELSCWEYTVRINCLAPGEVTFTATAKDDSGVSGSCSIKITEGPKLTSMVFDPDTYEEYEGAVLQLPLYAYGEEVDFYNENYGYFTYTFSDDTLAKYYYANSSMWDDDRECWMYRPYIKLLAPGEVTVTATAMDGSGVSASCTIVVKEFTKLTDLYYSPTVYEGKIGSYIYSSLYAISENPDAYKEVYDSFYHKSNNTSTVSTYGSYSTKWNDAVNCWVYHPAFICNAPGIATITSTARDGSGMVGTCQVIVRSDSPLVLPHTIKAIESEAFLSIAVEEIVLPEGIESIGSRAFADSTALKLINLPASLTSIAADAFEGSENVTLICAANSEGHRFAEESGIPYVIQ